MKILVFSDTHLTHIFDDTKFTFLKTIIAQADQVVINGDFWDGYLTRFDSFINSPWKQLFPVLKKKRAIYLFGNHDKPSLSDQRISLFSDTQAKQHRLSFNHSTLIIEHGNRFYPTIDETLKIKKVPTILMANTRKIFRSRRFGIYALTHRYLKRINRKIKEKAKREFINNEILICGHSHMAEFDLANRFINTGFIDRGIGYYVIIDHGKLSLKEEKYD